MKKILIAVLSLFLLAVFVAPVLAKGPSAPAGKSNKAHLYLYEKDPSTWEIVADGAWGKMTYDLSGPMFNYVFNGHSLMAEEEYTLIYYPDPWPGNSLQCLGSGMSNKGGELNLKGSVLTGDLPAIFDWNNPANLNNLTGTTIKGAKIWLVKSQDVSCDGLFSKMIGWMPEQYLFEESGIFFEGPDTDLVKTVELWTKDASWNPVSQNGTLTYITLWSTFQYIFDGKNLVPSTSYSLIYYADPWPGNNPGALIVSGMTDATGNIQLIGSIDTGSMPNALDANFGLGAKIWLVPSSDYDSTSHSMIGWNTANYLFEVSWVNYTKTP
ncbi:hypothetical protein A2V49_00855 [candidate division WWE3 bacterium RBG_19FT_COMBO_34_6]|uniref:Uncharacterized protein n=1 Tax=candidate division WWE3 bacterium RBG_19FT_COMBO_34_6 TaxID=1802612 RepID=A0A1F4UK48_UNCKA|nr:MAG: hypothetical protein A2V49_00855 [candidate division WWE3 bacterium RBG_19FT_COMBO_34_6]